MDAFNKSGGTVGGGTVWYDTTLPPVGGTIPYHTYQHNNMPTIDPLVSRTVGAALWDARPTVTDLRARQLAAALGYPKGWRVVRTIEEKKVRLPAESTGQSTTKTTSLVIVDRIYSGRPGPSMNCEGWFHHAAAQAAAAALASDNDDDRVAALKSHLLPRVARFEKGDAVQAYYDEQWWDAKIVRRKEHPVHGWRYQVHYLADKSKQSGVPEELIRKRPVGKHDHDEDKKKKAANKRSKVDPQDLALQLGFSQGWLAEKKGHNRYTITDPNGTVYHSKAKALRALEGGITPSTTSRTNDEGDPPWRTTGHVLLGRLVRRQAEHAVTARRTVTITQTGRVTGWIAATDVDRAGNAGYVSEATGQPAALFHVQYDETEASNHPYPSYLVDGQDLEEAEVQEMLMEPLDGDAEAAAAVKR